MILEETCLSEELIQNTFLYCVKRLHNTDEAEELSQEILTEALSAWRRNGVQITNLYAWYWKLAHHRYCLYLRKKQYGAVSLEETGGILISDMPDPSEGLIAEEELSALHLALSRLSSIHRETIIRYYLREQTVRQIAEDLGVPEGTVKRRLFDAKEQVREDMNMTNTGRSAYAPAELNMSGGYAIVDHWEKLGDLMIHQILIQCRREAKTIREIADEIGVAPVYFDSKIQYLLENRFLKEAGKGKYITDFIICPEEDYRNFYTEKAGIAAGMCPEIMEILLAKKEEICSMPFYGSDMPYGYLLWILCVYAANALSGQMLAMYEETHKGLPKNNGKSYRVSGRVRFPDETVIWPTGEELHTISWSNYHTSFCTTRYKQICHANLYDMPPFDARFNIISEANADLFMRIFDDPQLLLTPIEEETVSFWVSKGYMQKKENGMFPAMPVIPWKIKEKIEACLSMELKPLAEKYMPILRSAADKWLLPHVRKDLMEEYVHWVMLGTFYVIESLMYYAWHDAGLLDIPQDCSSSAAGICIYTY